MLKAMCLLVIASMCDACSTSENITVDKNLPNFFKVNENLYRGGQPNEAGIKSLKEKLGIKTVILFRTSGDEIEKEDEWAKEAGLKFISLPLHNWFKPKHAEVKAVLAEVTNPENYPVFVHCKRGADRTGTIIAIYRMTQEGWSPERASEEAKKFGIGWWQVWMKDYIKDYHRDFIAEK